jgi:hypothetical protein
MMLVDTRRYLRIDTADWSTEMDDFVQVATSPDWLAQLEFLTHDFCRSVSTGDLLMVARQRAPSTAAIEESACGQFAGFVWEYYEAEESGLQIFHREWALGLAEVMVLVEFLCESEDHEQYRQAVEKILSSLRDARP